MGRHCQQRYIVAAFTNCSLLNGHRGGLMPALGEGIRRRNQDRPSADWPCPLPHYLSSGGVCPTRLADLRRDVMAMIVGGESGDSLWLLRTTPTKGQTRAPLGRCPGPLGGDVRP